LDIERVDGSTGDTIMSSRLEVSAGTYFGVDVLGDHDGDGAMDLGIITYTYDETTGLETAAAELRSGRTDEVLSLDAPDAGQPIAANDLDGDGVDDVLFIDAEHGWSARVDITETAVSLAGGRLWERSSGLLADSYYDLLFAEDADGIAGDEIFSDVVQYFIDGPLRIESAYEQRSGLTGETGWRLGDSFTAPPPRRPPGTSSISGRILLEDVRPFPFACAAISDETGTILDHAETWDDRTFIFKGVPAGTYGIYGFDCWNRIHAPEWYDDADQFQDATLLTVGDGDVLTGIDLLLEKAPKPVNDERISAEPVTVPGSASARTYGASTAATDVASCADAGATVWYRFTAARSGTMQIDTTGSNFDTVLAVYAGPVGPAEVACNDDSAGLTSEVTVEVVEGVSYDVMVGGWYGEQGDLVLHLR
jgi:hypothetical protein